MLAPYPEFLAAREDLGSAHIVHAGFLSRFAARGRDRVEARRTFGLAETERLVTILCGRDGLGTSEGDLESAADAARGWRWHVLGHAEEGGPSSGGTLHRLGWVDDPWPHLLASGVVIAGASPSAVAEVADACVPLIVVPRRCADAEERCFADALGAAGAAVPLGSWPDPVRWPTTLGRRHGWILGPSPPVATATVRAARLSGSTRRRRCRPSTPRSRGRASSTTAIWTWSSSG